MLKAWNEFKKNKRLKEDVLIFEKHIENHLFVLHQELIALKYIPAPYSSFYVNDPKRRHIHKASVRDRVVQQALFRMLYPQFEKIFIFDSYAARVHKGTHLGMKRLHDRIRKLSDNWRKPVYSVKCDVRKFFDSIDHEILFSLIQKRVTDEKTLLLIKIVIKSFEISPNKGIPLGNVTSQLFGNIYLYELDRFVKHDLKQKHYFRYCDDFVLLSTDRDMLDILVSKIEKFLREELQLILHPQKIQFRTTHQGIDFVGFVSLPHTIVLRQRTKKRILKRLQGARGKNYESRVLSYYGVVSHTDERKLEEKILSFL